jgi:HEAT repeat protein
MRRLRLPICVALALATGLALLMAFPRSRFTLLAVVRNQEFQNDRPVGYWAYQLKDQDPQRREEAVRTLNSMGEKAKDSVPELIEALHDSEDIVRILAALALSKIGPDASEAVEALGKALSDPHPQVRMNSALALTKIGPAASPAIPQLIAAMQEPENRDIVRPFLHSVRQQAAMALANFGAASRDAIPALIDALTDSLYGTRFKAAYALGQIGPPATAAREPLLLALHDRNAMVAEEAGKALKRICPNDPEVVNLP